MAKTISLGDKLTKEETKIEKVEQTNREFMDALPTEFLSKTAYHYYRNFVKDILTDGGIKCFRFKKDAEGWDGKLLVAKPELEKAKQVLKDYKTKNPEVKPLWWQKQKPE